MACGSGSQEREYEGLSSYSSDGEDDISKLFQQRKRGRLAVPSDEEDTPPSFTPRSTPNSILRTSQGRTPKTRPTYEGSTLTPSLHASPTISILTPSSTSTDSGCSSRFQEKDGENDIDISTTPLSRLSTGNRQDPGGGTNKALTEVKDLLNTLVHRLENNEKELKELKRKMSTPSSSDGSSGKREICSVVRSETRKMYRTLLDDDENFEAFAYGSEEELHSWRSGPNRRAADKLVAEVKAINPDFKACDIRDSAYTYFKSLKAERSLSRRGKSEARKTSRRRSERVRRKLQERMSIFKKWKYSEMDKKKWLKMFVPEMMSSEESGDEEKNYVKPLSWRSSLVQDFFYDPDEEFNSNKSAQAKRQTKVRVVSSTISNRPVPENVPSWSIN